MNEYQPGLHKLIHHTDHLNKMAKGEIVAPLHVSVWPTLNCQLKCSYCCCRNVKDEYNQLYISEFYNAVDGLKKYGTKAIEFSGGGEPLLWYGFKDAVDYCYKNKMKLSLITNGLELSKISNNILKKFNWIRISVVSIEQIKNINILRIKEFTKVSLSYIVSNEDDLSILDSLYSFSKGNNVITRIGAQRPSNHARERMIEFKISKYGEPLFFSYKEIGQPLGCYMPWIRAAIDWNGNILTCPAIQLSSESEGCIPDKFKLCHINDLQWWLINNRVKDMGHRCKFCNCGKEINDYIHNMLSKMEDINFV